MARYSSSDSDEDFRRSKKKKKRKSRSRSGSSDESYSSKRSKKSKKSKKKQRKRSRSRSRSRSAEYRRRRSTSRSRGRRSRSRGRRSRSRSTSYTRYKSRRSRSRSRRRSRSFSRRRSRSFSRRRSRSFSRRSRSRSFSRRSRSRSRSKVKRRSRSRSRSKNVTSRSSSVSRDSKQGLGKTQKEDPCANIPGFEDMSAAEQNEVRMKMALKAAAETDARLREQGVLLPNKKEGIEMVYDDDAKRQKAIAEIEGESFAQQSFISNRGQQKVKEENADDIHEIAMFGDSASLPTTISKKGIVYSNTDSLLAPVFYEDSKVKWERWAQYVKDFRKAKLEGEEMK